MEGLFESCSASASAALWMGKSIPRVSGRVTQAQDEYAMSDLRR